VTRATFPGRRARSERVIHRTHRHASRGSETESRHAQDGETTVTDLGTSPPSFQIHSFFDVFDELSIAGGTFVPGPERTADLSETPEPQYLVAIGLLIVTMVARMLMLRRRNATA
jgi:hypothetical protein